MSLHSDTAAEITRLHKTIEVWTRGTVTESDQEFAAFANVLAPSFTIINPDGKIESRAKVVSRFRASHGARAGQGFSIEISDVSLVHDIGEAALLCYQEHWLNHGKRTSTILATVLLRRQEDLPQGITWLHLHEIWA